MEQTNLPDAESYEPFPPIKPSKLLITLLPRALKVLKRFRPLFGPNVLRLSSKYFLKFDCPPSSKVLEEAHTIDFLSKNTTIPIPKIISAFESKDGRGFLLMRKCPGVALDEVFFKMTTEEKQNVLRQLRGYFDQLRALKPPQPGKVGSPFYRPLDDFRIQKGLCGPFDNVAAFHEALRRGLTYPNTHPELNQMMEAQDSRDYEIKFTHGDFGLRHIFYKDGEITGIIDWTFAGWFPDYWEHVMSAYTCWPYQCFKKYFSEVLDPFPDELVMEGLREKLFCIY